MFLGGGREEFLGGSSPLVTGLSPGEACPQ